MYEILGRIDFLWLQRCLPFLLRHPSPDSDRQDLIGSKPNPLLFFRIRNKTKQLFRRYRT
jgi:hypothetical protein